VVSAIRQRLATLDPRIPVYRVETLDARVTNSLGGEKLAALMLSGFAAIALVLSVVGILGVTSYSVSQRVKEFGLRLALGAGPAHIIWLVVANATRLALAGAGVGCVAAYAMTRVLGTLLYGVRPTDALTMGGVGTVLIGVAIAASLIPARRAMRMDANVALRSD
ncbi:MAG TPA: FtsX-like permease family protein, partial [Gemmatimonadaceae bacterium]|nr:FtsX-like permease family protein [Gemmatimonadaceae bacterium]